MEELDEIERSEEEVAGTVTLDTVLLSILLVEEDVTSEVVEV